MTMNGRKSCTRSTPRLQGRGAPPGRSGRCQSCHPFEGVQVVFIPFGSLSLWFLRTMLNQHEFGGCSCPAVKVMGLGANPSSVSLENVFSAVVTSAAVGESDVIFCAAFSNAMAGVHVVVAGCL